jgi:amino acid adenylation domain-containing protein
LPRSFEAVHAILGTLMAGGVYVPIDVGAPKDRLSFLYEDIQARVFFATEDVASRLEPDGKSATRLVVVPEVDRAGLVRALENPVSRADLAWPKCSLDAPAAILYTSGSTGRPKGVVLSHRNVSSFVGWAILRLGLRSDDRFVSHAPLHFDLSTLDLFAALSLGARLYLPDEKTLRFPAALAKALERQQSTVLYCVPTALRLLVEYGALARRDLSSLRNVFFAGEVFPLPALRSLMQALPEARFVNLYGPTETNVCTYHLLDSIPDASDHAIPIGMACEQLEVAIIEHPDDGHFACAGPGVVGEICVRGPNVFAGYHGDEASSLACRVGDDPTTYRTGDFGALDQDGRIWFSGRRDFQIKIRGHRVELLEVERVLAAHAGVADAACVLAQGGTFEAEIVAYVTPKHGSWGSELGPIELTRHCQSVLMGYAVPKRFIVCEQGLPLTASGKVNRKELEQRAQGALGVGPASCEKRSEGSLPFGES